MKCEACNKFRKETDLKSVTIFIDYSLGPVSQLLCSDCIDNERIAWS